MKTLAAMVISAPAADDDDDGSGDDYDVIFTMNLWNELSNSTSNWFADVNVIRLKTLGSGRAPGLQTRVLLSVTISDSINQHNQKLQQIGNNSCSMSPRLQ